MFFLFTPLFPPYPQHAEPTLPLPYHRTHSHPALGVTAGITCQASGALPPLMDFGEWGGVGGDERLVASVGAWVSHTHPVSPEMGPLFHPVPGLVQTCAAGCRRLLLIEGFIERWTSCLRLCLRVTSCLLFTRKQMAPLLKSAFLLP